MKKFALHIASIIVCLGIFVSASATVLSSLALNIEIELKEGQNSEREVIELSESIFVEQEALISTTFFVPSNLIKQNKIENDEINSSSKGITNRLHLLYESYLI